MVLKGCEIMSFPSKNFKPKNIELKDFVYMMVKLNHLTIKDFCIELKIRRSLFYEYMHDKKRPSLATVIHMSDILECSPKEILQYVKPRKRFYGKHVY